jgi:hypothetical protein
LISEYLQKGVVITKSHQWFTKLGYDKFTLFPSVDRHSNLSFTEGGNFHLFSSLLNP